MQRSRVEPSICKNIGIVVNANNRQIYWQDPGDTVIDDHVISTWAGTKLVKKLNSYPETETDGTLVIDNKELGKYAFTPYVDNVASTQNYFYRLFPYNIGGTVSRNKGNCVYKKGGELLITLKTPSANYEFRELEDRFNSRYLLENGEPLSIPYPTEIMIDWGDGSEKSYFNSDDPETALNCVHTYETIGTFTIHISGRLCMFRKEGKWISGGNSKGIISAWSVPTSSASAICALSTSRKNLLFGIGTYTFYCLFGDNNYMTTLNPEVLSNLTDETDFSGLMAFSTAVTTLTKDVYKYLSKAEDLRCAYYAIQKVKSIPSDLFSTVPNAKDFSGAFYGTSITTIPQDLFKSCPKATGFSGTFGSCTSLATLPATLWPVGTLAEDFSDCFYGASALKSIPQTLFTNCTNAKSFRECFKGTTNVKTVSETLFATCTKATNFNSLFSGITVGNGALTTIPEGLFSKNVLAEDFGVAFAACPITTIPTNLFKNNTKAKNFQATFQNTKITAIPDTLFSTCTEAENFSYCFALCYYCSTIPSYLFLKNTKAKNFAGCFEMFGIETSSAITIPDTLFSTCVAAEDFSELFLNTRIKEIPANLFKQNTKAKNFRRCFVYQYTTSSTMTIPENLFASCVEAEDFGECFYWRSDITTIPANLFKNNVKAKSFAGTFTSCSKITSIPAALFTTCTQAKNFSKCFSGLSITTIPDTLFNSIADASDVDFSECFQGCRDLIHIPTLWTRFTKAKHTDCFSNCSKADNYAEAQSKGWA